MSASREIELKLEIDPDSTSQLHQHSLLAAVPAKTVDQLSVYYDTPDGALRTAGFSLRVRQAGKRYIQTVKQSAGASAGLFDRPEWEEEVASLSLDMDAAERTPLVALLTKKVRKRLAPLIHVEVRRSKWDVRWGESDVELIIDEGSVAGGDAREPIGEIEMELKKGEALDLFAFASELAQLAPLRLGVLTKAERGYRLADGQSAKPVKSEAILLDQGMDAAKGFAAIANACLRQFRLNEPLVVQSRNPNALHQARVAMRRLRSAFTLFRPVINGERYEALREEVRWFTNQLGDARNLDVMLKRFGTADDDVPEASALVAQLEAERAQAYAQVLDALGSPRLRTLMLALAEWIEIGTWRSENELAGVPIGKFADRQLDRRWKKVRKGGRDLAGLEPEERHQLRIEVKKLRYAVEFLASLTADEAGVTKQKQFVHALEDMQEELGELNDVETARTMLADLLRGEANSEPLLRYAWSKLEAPESNKKPLAAAQQAHTQLITIGRFWR